MSGVSPKSEWQLMMDYTFVRNRMPKITPAGFRRKHTKGFLEMLHPNATLDDDTLRSMETRSSDVVILSAYYDEKVALYYAKSGVSLHHLLIATQSHCVVCEYPSKPEVSRCYTLLVYASLGEEPRAGTMMPTRCTNKLCRHRGNYGWDVVSNKTNKSRLFKPFKDRHTLPYWVCSTLTAFVTTMISKEMFSQVLWNHAGCLTMANQGNWLLGHYEKLIHAERDASGTGGKGARSHTERKGIERRQLQRAFLEFLYHRTVISLGGSTELLECSLPPSGKKPSLKDVVTPHLDKFIDLFHDRWYRDHKTSSSEVPGHGIFEMYDGQWTMVRQTCAVDWCGVIDVGSIRIRRSCRNTPAFKSAFCSSCLQNRATTKLPVEVAENRRLNFVGELQRMKYLQKGQYFIEAVFESRGKKKRREVKVKWVGYPDCTWEPFSVLSKTLRNQLNKKILLGEPCTLTVHEIWDEFFDDPDSSIFDTKAAKSAYTCNTRKEIVTPRSRGKKHNRVAALCIGVGGDGVVESVYESFRSESLSQLWLHRLYLTKRYPQLAHEKTIVGYDDGCHYHAYVSNTERAQASPEAGIIAKQVVIIDNCHLRGHTDARCKEKFDPKKHPLAKSFNTQVAEQTFSWFGKYKHIGRYMMLISYWVFIIGAFNERNLVCVAKQKEKAKKRLKRKRVENKHEKM